MQKKQILELQSIRGIAALIVLFAHSLAYFSSPLVFETGPRLVNAHVAVIIFFILSGYVLSLSLKDKLKTKEHVIAFYIKRVFRIYPAMWVATPLSLLYLEFVHPSVPEAGKSIWFNRLYRGDETTGARLFLSLLGFAFILPVLWTIVIELIASALMPIIAWIMSHYRRLFWVLTAFLMAVSLTIGIRSYYAVLVYLVYFAFGASLAGAVPGVGFLSKISPTTSKLLFGLALGLMFVPHLFWITDYDDPWISLVEGTGSTLLVALILFGAVDIPVLRSRVATFTGDISYGLYLLHFPIMCFFGAGLRNFVQPAYGDTLLLSALLTACVLVTTVPLAWVSYRFIELPGIRLGAKVAAAFNGKVA